MRRRDPVLAATLMAALLLVLVACKEKSPEPTAPSVQRGIDRSVGDVRAAEAAAAAPLQRSLTIAEATARDDDSETPGKIEAAGKAESGGRADRQAEKRAG